jgi:5'-deoxynucleotidase YfbR-like HD superfamily hydrolase
VSCNPAAADEMIALWEEYENGETDVAKRVRAIDVMQRGHQAMIYEERAGKADKFEDFKAELENINCPGTQRLADQLLQDWETRRSRRDADVAFVFVIGWLRRAV